MAAGQDCDLSTSPSPAATVWAGAMSEVTDMRSLSICFVAVAIALAACGDGVADAGDTAPGSEKLPAAAWDHKPEAARWTGAVLDALDGPGVALIEEVPVDAAQFCPAFPEADREDRKAFWVGFLSALAGEESTWRPDVSGGGGRWHGLLQISPATAEGYGCDADTASALRSGPANLRCAVRIMGTTVARDGVIAEGGGGVAADWGPLRRSAQATEIAAFTRSQGYCRKR